MSSHPNLKNVPVGESAKVLRVTSHGALRQRILDMGITRGTALQVIKRAPLGDPIEILVRGYTLSLRRSEAEHIIIE